MVAKGHCGQDCGRREFAVTWDEIEAAYDRRVSAKTRREAIAQLLKGKDEHLNAAIELHSRTVAMAQRASMVLIEVNTNPAVRDALDTCAKSGGEVRVAEETSAEIRDAMGVHGRQRQLRTIGLIAGVEAIGEHYAIPRELRYRVIDSLAALTQAAVDAMDEDEIAIASKAMGSYRGTQYARSDS